MAQRAVRMISPIGKRRQTKRFTQALRTRAGFTLIELMLVILLIAVLVGLSAPLFQRSFSDLQLRSTTFNIAKTINYAGEMSIIERVKYRLNFEVENNKYWITRYDSAGGISGYKRIGGKYRKFFFLPEGLEFSGEVREITFYPDGRSDNLEIGIVDKKGNGRLVRVKGFGRSVEIEELKNE
jgi:prepilin-type N-terminal cleavage/methylation domain-containing protein